MNMFRKEYRALFLTYGANCKQIEIYCIFEGIVREIMSLLLKGRDCKTILRPRTWKSGMNFRKVRLPPKTASFPVPTADGVLEKNGQEDSPATSRAESSQGLCGRLLSLLCISDYWMFLSFLTNGSFYFNYLVLVTLLCSVKCHSFLLWSVNTTQRKK